MAPKLPPDRPFKVNWMNLILPFVGMILGLVLCRFAPESVECKMISEMLANGIMVQQTENIPTKCQSLVCTCSHPLRSSALA